VVELTPKPPLRIPLRRLVVSLMALLAILIALVAIVLQYYFSRDLAIESATNRYQMTARATHSFLQNAEDRAVQITRILARYPVLIHTNQGEPSMRDLFAEVMHSNPMFYSIYLGFPNGDFYELVNLDSDPAVRDTLGATAADRWLVNRVVKGFTKRRMLEFYTEDFQLTQSREELSQYDVRERQWYIEAQADKVNKSAPYMFQYIQKPGHTYAIKLPDNNNGGGNVLAIDITLDAFSAYLKSYAPSLSGELYLYQSTGEIIASNRLQRTPPELPQVTPLTLTKQEQEYLEDIGVLQVSNEMDWPPVDFAVAGEPRGYAVDLMRLLARKLDMPLEFINGYSWDELVDKFESGQIDILQPLSVTQENQARGLLSEPILTIPQGLALRKDTPSINRAEELAGKILAVPSGWSIIGSLQQAFPEIEVLLVDNQRDALQAVIDKRAFAAVDAEMILRFTARQYFMEDRLRIDSTPFIAQHLPSDLALLFPADEPQLQALFNRALKALSPQALEALHKKWFAASSTEELRASRAIVPYHYLLQSPKQSAHFNQLRREKIKGQDVFVFTDVLHTEQGNAEYFSVVTPVQIVLAESLNKVMVAVWVTGGLLLLLLPISWLISQLMIGPIRHLHSKATLVEERRYQEVRHSPSFVKEVDDLSRSVVTMAQSIQQHEKSLRQLMEDIIRLIADAIDEKSPYTAGHCARVPELALMLVEAAENSSAPAFKDFRFNNDDERTEFRIGAWLHDCGKITVPEHIVDKGTKLECIYNRIHEIRTRFEVLWRDARILCLENTLASPERADEFALLLAQEQQQLQEDFTFLAEINIGGEFLAEEKLQRLRRLAQKTWWRQFDNRLGLSPVENDRLFDADTSVSLPVEEPLLADRSEHLIARARSTDYYQSLGVRMEVPEYLYNLGEVHNLSIERGTLTPEDRFKINEHIISTIRMLEGLPFPPQWSQVPRYASTHHETMKGTGYPRKLSAEDLSIPERIMAVADIFEALTAADRPYKKAKSLSESIRILHQMALDEHVDIQVFHLFLSSGIYRRYAEQYLDPSQIDQVDIAQYLAGAEAEG